jgi:uncharacterized protein
MTIHQIQQKALPILRKHNIRKAGIFGSYARHEEGENSDIDFLVELSGTTLSLLGFMEIKLALEEKIEKKVDLVDYQAIKPAIREQILREEIRIL